MGRLDGKVALVTGAARGQGRSHAVRLAEEGADVVIIDVPSPVDWVTYPLGTSDELAATATQIEACGRRVLSYEVDVRDGAALRAAVADAVAALGRLDVVVANAGVGPVGHSFWEIPEQEWQDMIDINLGGVWRTVSAAVPTMIEAAAGGSIIVTSSAAALRGASNIAAYNAAKTGAVALVQTMARELARHYIRVNAIAPSSVGTPMILNEANFRLFTPGIEHPTQEEATPAFRRLNLIPEPWLDVTDISNAVAFLASDEARYITGVTLPVDLGGMLK